MKNLLLGAQGNLGSQLLKALSPDEVIPWTRQDCDLTDLNAVAANIQQLQPTVVINTAAYNNVDACEKNLAEQQKAIILNVLLVDCLADICQKINAKLVQFSSNYVFSGEQVDYQENDQPDPINFYGLTKQLG